MVKLMRILNLTPDSFWAPSRADASDALRRIEEMEKAGDWCVDIGAVSTRPGASDVTEEEEWARLEPVLKMIAEARAPARHPINISIDTVRSSIVRKTYELIGNFIVNDISAGEYDPGMLRTVGELGLRYVAMHKRGNPRTMDGLADYPDGIMPELMRYFRDFSQRAESAGIKEWILDPGLGFAKTPEQCWEILENLKMLEVFGREILIGASDKRFTGGDNAKVHELAVRNGATILRLH